MYFNGKSFSVDLVPCQTLRDFLLHNVYPKPGYIEELMVIIDRNMDCTSITFDGCRMQFNIVIKKTIMRKAKSEYPIYPSYYFYDIMYKSFVEFVNSHLVEFQNMANTSPYPVVFDNATNVCQILITGEKTLTIKL